MEYKTLHLLVCTVEVVAKYFKEGSPAYNCLMAATKEMVKQEFDTVVDNREPLEINRNIKFPPSMDNTKYC